jgi:hypothetical protein
LEEKKRVKELDVMSWANIDNEAVVRKKQHTGMTVAS